MFESVISGAQDLIITGAGLVVAGVLGWWKGKSSTQKKELLKDSIDVLDDGKITKAEIKALIDEHL